MLETSPRRRAGGGDQTHIDQLAAEYVRRGLSSRDARAAAHRDFGSTELTSENCRDQRGIRWLGTLARDMRVGARSLLRAPAVTDAIVLTLAIGVGANAAPLPVPTFQRSLRDDGDDGVAGSESRTVDW